jgi:phosphopantetheine--protein transferase-like protein
MVNGIGIDAIEIARFNKFRGNNKHQFVKKVFTEKEIRYCFRYQNPASHLAGIFAVKESVSKAFGGSIFLADIEVRHNSNGAPEVWKKNKKMKSVLVSLTHTDNIALAIAIR